MTRPILRDMPLGRGLLLVLAMCAVAGTANSAPLRAYLRAFWHGDTTGPAEWLGWAGVGLVSLAIAGTVVAGLCWLSARLERYELNDPNDFGADDVRDPTKE